MEISTKDIITYSIIALAILILLFIIMREVSCWYWKINERLAEQRKTNELLAEVLAAVKSDLIK